MSNDSGELHDDPTFGKVPDALIHDLEITDGAVRLFAHMHWRYGKNKRNFEGQKSVAEHLGVSRTTIHNRIDELAAKDWVIVIQRDFNIKTGNFTTPYYHVFVSQDQCRKWRESYKSSNGEVILPRPEARIRVSRKGKGGKIENLRRANSSSHGHANLSSDGVANSSSHGHANLSSDYPDSSYPDSVSQKQQNTPSKSDTSKPNSPPTPTAAPPLPPNYVGFMNGFKPLPAILEAWHDAHPVIKPSIPRNQRDRYIEEAEALAASGITPEDMAAFIKERLTNGQKTTWAFIVTDIHDFMQSRNRKKPATSLPKRYEPEPARAPLTPEQIAAIKREVANGQ